MNLSRFVKVYLVPGAVFQSVLVGGGYGTGREVIEYFTQFGARGGLAAMGVALLFFFVTLGLTFEVARKFSAYDYRSFFQQLLGRAWFVYELIAVFMLLLVFAVLMAAAGTVLMSRFGIPMGAGIAVMIVLVVLLEFFGRDAVTRVLSLWSIVLYAVFITFLFSIFKAAPDKVSFALTSSSVEPGWALSGFKYAMYNMTGAPIILFVARHFKTTGEAVGSGAFAAVIALAPALMFHIAFAGQEAALLAEEIPVYAMMGNYGLDVLSIAFTIMLFGTLIETGAGTLQGINERIEGYRKDKSLKPLSRWSHAAIAFAILSLSAVVAQFGITALIGQGYGMIAWAFFLVYFIPLITIGLYKITRPSAP
jgi:uncharacterized membrane protein YkvI